MKNIFFSYEKYFFSYETYFHRNILFPMKRFFFLKKYMKPIFFRQKKFHQTKHLPAKGISIQYGRDRFYDVCVAKCISINKIYHIL